jgi:hypothetical protein
MTDNEILEGNKLIAEFMGGAYNKQNDDFMFVLGNCPTKHASCIWDSILLQYDASWEWLMPVVEKIGALPNINVNISSFDGCNIYDDDYKNTAKGMRIFAKGDLIKSVWLAVVEFIKWFNQNK